MPFARSSFLKYLRFSAADLMHFGEAWFTLGAMALKLKLIPFEQIMRFNVPKRSGILTDAEINRLVWAVNAARRRSWLRAKCIESALALRSMLRRRGVVSTLHYGVRTAAGESLNAHVWLSIGGEIVIGSETAERFAQVATFDPPAAV